MIGLLRPCKTCGATFPTNRSQAYCSPACRPKPEPKRVTERQHYSDAEARAQEIADDPVLRRARRECRLWGPPEPVSVKLDRLRNAGRANRAMEMGGLKTKKAPR